MRSVGVPSVHITRAGDLLYRPRHHQRNLMSIEF
jgi:hypothetical protein